MDDPVAVALEGVAGPPILAPPLGMEPAARAGRIGRKGRAPGHLAASRSTFCPAALVQAKPAPPILASSLTKACAAPPFGKGPTSSRLVALAGVVQAVRLPSSRGALALSRPNSRGSAPWSAPPATWTQPRLGSGGGVGFCLAGAGVAAVALARVGAGALVRAGVAGGGAALSESEAMVAATSARREPVSGSATGGEGLAATGSGDVAVMVTGGR